MPSFVSLNLNKDFLRLYHKGKSCAKPTLVVYCMKNRLGLCRVGITTGKKIGGAVQRNRMILTAGTSFLSPGQRRLVSKSRSYAPRWKTRCRRWG